MWLAEDFYIGVPEIVFLALIVGFVWWAVKHGKPERGPADGGGPYPTSEPLPEYDDDGYEVGEAGEAARELDNELRELGIDPDDEDAIRNALSPESKRRLRELGVDLGGGEDDV